MKPKPFSGLNHFTVPVATAIPSLRGRLEPASCSVASGLIAGEGTARSFTACGTLDHKYRGSTAPEEPRRRSAFAGLVLEGGGLTQPGRLQLSGRPSLSSLIAGDATCVALGGFSLLRRLALPLSVGFGHAAMIRAPRRARRS